MVLEPSIMHLYHVLSTHTVSGSLMPADIRPLQIKSHSLEVLRLSTFRRLQVCAEFVHVIESLCEECPTGVDLHQGQIIQLKHKRKHRVGLRSF